MKLFQFYWKTLNNLLAKADRSQINYGLIRIGRSILIKTDLYTTLLLTHNFLFHQYIFNWLLWERKMLNITSEKSGGRNEY